MARTGITFVMLATVWLMWSGHMESNLLLFGLLSVLAVMGISYRMDASVEIPRVYRLGMRPLAYIPWLLWQIVRANLDVTRIILNPKLPISPRLIQVRASQSTDLGRVIYANSITLTPGTVSLDIRDGIILVNALTVEAAEGVQNGEMDRRVTLLEGDADV